MSFFPRLPRQQRHFRCSRMLLRLSLLLLSVLLLSLQSCCHAFVPPRPGSELAKTFEPVEAYRRRLNITYKYTPTFLNEELCRYLTEEECQDADESMQAHAKSHQEIQRRLNAERRQLQQQQQQSPTSGRANPGGIRGGSESRNSNPNNQEEFQELLGEFTRAYGRGPAHQPTLEEELAELEELLREFNTTKEEHYRRRRELTASNRANEKHSPSVGTFVVPLFLMQFTDHADRPLPPKYEYQILWNLRITKWIRENSYNQYNAFFEVYDWQMTDNTEVHYSYDRAGRVAKFQFAFHPLLTKLDEELNGDWSLYDANGDGIIDNIIVLHSSYAAEEGGTDCTNGRAEMQRIWSHAFSNSNGWVSSNGQYKTQGYMIASALDLTCDANPAKMGVMTHEYLHTFFLIDLYDTRFVGRGIGNFDIMSYPYGVQNDGYIPVHLSAWAKQTIEWLKCDTITSAGEYTLQPIAMAPSCYRIILSDFDPTQPEYLLLENRQQTSFDIEFWKPGLVMYHIDDAASDQRNVGYPGFEDGWPMTGNHYRVSVVQADRKYELEMNYNIGDAGDVWEPGMALTPNTPDGQTWPNTDTYQHGDVENTGITITVLEPDGLNVRIKVDMGTRSGGPPIFSAPVRDFEDNEGVNLNDDTTLGDLADNQFVVPDDPEHGISGMIPQLGWFDGFRKEEDDEENVGLDAAAAHEDMAPPPPDPLEQLPPVEDFDGAFVFSAQATTRSSTSSGSAGALQRGGGPLLLAVVLATTTLYHLCG